MLNIRLLRTGGRKDLAGRDQRLDPRQCNADAVGKREGFGRGSHAFGRADEQFGVEQLAQARQVVANDRLAEADPGGDAAFGQERVEGDEQVEVDPGQIDVVDGHYEFNRLE
jgi:hypothetical protein